MPIYYESNNELMHYGVPGMKWGKRKSPEYDAYKQSKKDFRREAKNYRKKTRFAFGIEGIKRGNEALKSYQKKEMDMIDAKAKYKASKAKDKIKATKAEQKTYVNAMLRSGLPGSAADASSANRSTAIYNSISKKKGKKYADAIAKRAQRTLVRNVVTSTVVAVGSTVALNILADR